MLRSIQILLKVNMIRRSTRVGQRSDDQFTSECSSLLLLIVYWFPKSSLTSDCFPELQIFYSGFTYDITIDYFHMLVAIV